jgi:iron complex transport system substrate-binding protein
MRIISLLPSATEIVCALGLEDQLVGVTHECDFPPSVKELPKVTRTLIPTDASSETIDRLVREERQAERSLYALDMPVLESLAPDLIVTQTLCDVCAVADDEVRAAACSLPGTPRLLHLEPTTLDEVLASIHEVARAAGIEAHGRDVVAALQSRIDAVLARSARAAHRSRVALLEWLDPPFSCGHWSPEIVRLAGGVEGLGAEGDRSRRLRWDEVIAWQPEVVVIACCGFTVERTLLDVPMLDAVRGWPETPAARSGRVYVVDGSSYFSRPGPRLVESLEILAHALDPVLHPLPLGIAAPVRLDARQLAGS